MILILFFFNDTATTEIYTLSLHDALPIWELGGVPGRHRTDCLSAAINNLSNKEEFTERYKALLGHYRLEGNKTQPNSPNENGDVEQSHNRFKKALDQKLMLRGSRDFTNRQE